LTDRESLLYTYIASSGKEGITMKVAIIFTCTGPILVLTSYESLTDPAFVDKLAAKGIKKFIASELPIDTVKERYGEHFRVVIEDLYQTDDLRCLDYNGYNILQNFSFKEMGKPIYYEP
jgi:hypothetical protein